MQCRSDDASQSGITMAKLTSKPALDLKELGPIGIHRLEVLVHEVEVLLLDVKQVVAVHVVEGLAACDPARVDLEDGLGRLAIARVDLDVECVSRYRHDLLLDDELGLLVRVDELSAPDGRVHRLESTHAGDVCLVSHSTVQNGIWKGVSKVD